MTKENIFQRLKSYGLNLDNKLRLKGEHGDRLDIIDEGDELVLDAYIDGVAGVFSISKSDLFAFVKQEKDYY